MRTIGTWDEVTGKLRQPMSMRSEKGRGPRSKPSGTPLSEKLGEKMRGQQRTVKQSEG